MGAFGIGHLNLIDPTERFDDALFGKLPNVAGKRRRFVHQLPVIVEDEVAEQFFTLLAHCLAGVWPAAAAPEDAFDFWMSIQIFLQQSAHISLRQFAENFFMRRRNHFVVARKHRLIDIRAPFLEPFLRHLGIGEALRDPRFNLHIAKLRRVPLVRFDRF